MGLFDGSWSGSRVWGCPCPRDLRRPRSEEHLKIPIARGLPPGLLPCMTWTAKFRTTYITALATRGYRRSSGIALPRSSSSCCPVSANVNGGDE